jgi:xanthine/CO dehydrogenase XdhC/CoxF family maturation factor
LLLPATAPATNGSSKTVRHLEAGLVPGGQIHVIVTRGHRHDMRVLGWAVNTPAHSIGMIGSKRKVLTVCQELQKQGVSSEKLKRAHAPIGLNIGATTPEEIAVSIVAELIADRRRCEAALPHLGCVDALVDEEAAAQPSKK